MYRNSTGSNQDETIVEEIALDSFCWIAGGASGVWEFDDDAVRKFRGRQLRRHLLRYDGERGPEERDTGGMAGTWTQTGLTVNISQSADTFVRNMPFAMSFDPAGGWDLFGDTVFSNTRIQLLLKQR